jgi:hypothetical protein
VRKRERERDQKARERKSEEGKRDEKGFSNRLKTGNDNKTTTRKVSTKC